MNVKHIGLLQMSATDSQYTYIHTYALSHDLYVAAAAVAAALVYAVLPATCCCWRPDWPGKRQIRRTIA